jgi:hypothetical protein
MGKGRRTTLEKFPTSFLAKGDLLGVETNNKYLYASVLCSIRDLHSGNGRSCKQKELEAEGANRKGTNTSKN